MMLRHAQEAARAVLDHLDASRRNSSNEEAWVLR